MTIDALAYLFHSQTEDGTIVSPDHITITLVTLSDLQNSNREEERFWHVRSPGFRFVMLISYLKDTSFTMDVQNVKKGLGNEKKKRSKVQSEPLKLQNKRMKEDTKMAAFYKKLGPREPRGMMTNLGDRYVSTQMINKPKDTRSKSPKVKKRKIVKKKEEEETQKSTKPKIQKESYASVVKRTGVNFGNPVMESSLEDLNMHQRLVEKVMMQDIVLMCLRRKLKRKCLTCGN